MPPETRGKHLLCAHHIPNRLDKPRDCVAACVIFSNKQLGELLSLREIFYCEVRWNTLFNCLVFFLFGMVLEGCGISEDLTCVNET